MTHIQDEINDTYGKNARFDDTKPLSEGDLITIAPSIFAMTAHESRSPRFAPIPTIEVLRRIAQEGFVAVGAKQSIARDPGKAPYTKHLIRLRKIEDRPLKAGDTVFETLLTNANDGSARYRLRAALWRIRCMNSLVAHDANLGEIAIRHTGDAAMEVLEASNKLLTKAGDALKFVRAWQKVDLEEPERMAFAAKAHSLRFDGKTYGVASALAPERLLEARRHADTGHDLWSVFNVVQENIMKGGQEGDGHDSLGKSWRYRSRPIKGIDADVTMNTALWGLADEFAREHGVQV